MFNKILCPTDDSDHANKALDLAIDMAKNTMPSLSYCTYLIVLKISTLYDDLPKLRGWHRMSTRK
jgi:hypothetical protein